MPSLKTLSFFTDFMLPEFANSELLAFLLQGSWYSHLVLITLVLMSSFSWAVIITKWFQLFKVSRENRKFQIAFGSSTRSDQLQEYAKSLVYSSFAKLFQPAYHESLKFRERLNKKNLPSGDPSAMLQRRLERIMEQTILQQQSLMENRLGILASVSSSAPFIGLFGTVLGVIDSFQSIGREGSTSLATVAPGMSEALIATAAGLLAAIPALIAYNYFRNSIQKIQRQTNTFAANLINRLEWSVLYKTTSQESNH